MSDHHPTNTAEIENLKSIIAELESGIAQLELVIQATGGLALGLGRYRQDKPYLMHNGLQLISRGSPFIALFVRIN